MSDSDELRRELGGGSRRARGLPFQGVHRGPARELAPGEAGGFDPGRAALLRSGYPPDLYPPHDATQFALGGVLATASTTFLEVAAITLPENARGVVRQIELTVAGTITDLTDARFRLEVGGLGQAAPGWDNFRVTPAAAAAVTFTADEAFFLRLPAGSTLRVLARAADANLYTFTGRMLGWSWGD